MKLFFGFRDGPNGPEDDVNGDSIDLLFDTMKAATILPLGLKKLNELKREEGRILDQLESLGVKRELTKAEQRDKIFEEMANRKAEWERIRQRETDQEQLRRLKNIYDDADARDEDRLRKLL
ncbi:MAG TPA: hypothetical protein VFP64_15360 [Pyrinomonadaceae bacterium]|nr:hypothetical protein [Pyrinomonadaceae bacterium]